MDNRKSSRNKTIELSPSEISRYSERLVQPSQFAFDGSLRDVVVHGDMNATLDLLPTAFVDLLFLDPPYNLNKQFGEVAFSRISDDDYEHWVESWVSRLVRTLKPNASIYACGDWQSSSALYRVLGRYFTIRNRITWEREKGRGAQQNWKNSSEDIWFATVGKEYYFNVEAVKVKKKVIAPYRTSIGDPKDWNRESDGNFRLTFPSNLWTDITVPFWSMPENTDHPTQKPEKLLAKILLASSKEGDVILDPFLGSGSTAVVAKKLHRHYVGIEIDQRYCCLAEKRLEMASVNQNIQGYTNGVFWERNISLASKEEDSILQGRLF